MKTKLAAIALLGAVVATPALAWGDREQGALAGIVGTLLWQRSGHHHHGHPGFPSYPSNAPVYGYPQPPVIYSAPPPPVRCRSVLTVEIDRYGNEYRYPVTVCDR